MKLLSKLLILLVCATFFSSCFTNKMITKKPGASINDLEFTLTKVAQNKRMNYGPGYAVVIDEETGKLGRFYLIEMTMKNLSNSEMKVDLTKVCLCDINKNCLAPTVFMLKTIVDLPSRKIVTVKPNRKRGRKLIFSGSKDFKPEYILLNSESNEYIRFDYKK